MRLPFVLAIEFCVVGFLAGVTGDVSGSRTQSFQVGGIETFGKARMNGVSLDPDGLVSPGPTAHLVAPDAGAQVWFLLRAGDGGIYAGSGSGGAVYRISGDKAQRLAETFEYEVFSLVEGKGGRIFASGAPNGTIVEIKADGTITTLFDTPEKIVWAMVADADGNIYAATGERGLIYKITPAGSASVLYRAEDTHVVSLAWSAEGKLLAGTDGRGLLLEIDPRSGAGKVLYDAALPEIMRVMVGPDGVVYFVVSGIPPAPSSPVESVPEPASTDQEKGEEPLHLGPVQARLYLREPNGIVRAVWKCPEETIHALALDSQGRILVGTGGDAALYAVTRSGDATLLWKPEEGQLTCLLVKGEEILAGTGNPGHIFRLSPDPDGDTWIRPDPMDAGSSAQWGRAVWEVLPGEGRWQVRTRSGHTEKPDSSWSEWSEPLTDPEGSLITSPPARFLQCEARFTGGGGKDAARLRRIWIPYSEPNDPPRILALRFSPDEPPSSKEARDGGSFTQELGGGVRVQVLKAPPTSAGDGNPVMPPWARQVRSVAWDAMDPNGDDLLFKVAIRQVGDDRFRDLAKDLTTNVYAVDTGTLPDGLYEIRVTASDAPSNAPAEAEDVSRVGGPFRVDHRAPELIDLSARHDEPLKLTVAGRAKDDASLLKSLEVSWDGHPWRPMIPTDGFMDSKEESFRADIPLEREDEGSWVAVRVVDAAGNESIGRAWLEK